MKEQTWTFERPEDIRQGPWLFEPDKHQFTAHGMPCLLRRGGCNAWCGYVGVSKGHPYFEVDYDDCAIDVHGGLTFAGKCQHSEHGICHTVEEGEDDDIWWLGFDCGHYGDILPCWNPGDYLMKNFEEATYKTFDWVKEETTRLAKQLAEKLND